jgi:hypothetical protein
MKICGENTGSTPVEFDCGYVCKLHGMSCATGCFSNLSYGWELRAGCAGALKGTGVGCGAAKTLAPGEALRCCCAD